MKYYIAYFQQHTLYNFCNFRNQHLTLKHATMNIEKLGQQPNDKFLFFAMLNVDVRNIDVCNVFAILMFGINLCLQC
jgi:hypothetical protein